MASFNSYSLKIELVEDGKIIAYKLDEFLTIKEFKSLPKKIQKKFKAVYEIYKVNYLKD